MFQWQIQNFYGGGRGTNLLFDQIFPKLRDSWAHLGRGAPRMAANVFTVSKVHGAMYDTLN